MSGRGPLVPPEAHRAATLFLAAVGQFVAAMAAVQLAYPGYSDLANPISDLGDPARSPWHLVFDLSALALGLLGLAATYLVRVAFRPGRLRLAGLGLLALANVGVIGVGLFPEGSPHGLHTIVAGLAFVASGLALLLLAGAMLRDTRWDGLRLYSALSGALVLAAVAAYSSPIATDAVRGLVERIIVAPALLWLVLASIHLLRVPTYEPSGDASAS